MAVLTIRNIDDALKTGLRVQAARHARSMEEEARCILASRQKAGKRIAAEDAQIAAIACSRGFGLATRNVADFAGVAGLEIVNPWDAA